MDETIRAKLVRLNNNHGKGMVLSVVWGVPYAGLPHDRMGLVVRQMQYSMDAVRFSIVGRKLRFLRHTVTLELEPEVRQTGCRYCSLDIENTHPFRRGEWRDRGNNTHCNDGKHQHAPHK